MKKIILLCSMHLFFCSALSLATDIATAPDIGTAVSGDALISVDASEPAGSRVKRIILTGDSTSFLSGEGTLISTSTLPVSTEQQAALDLKSDKTNVIEKDNTEAFVPTADYHPATKKYVDENGGTITIPSQSDCSTITSGLCRDSDDDTLWWYNGTTVVEVGTGLLDALGSDSISVTDNGDGTATIAAETDTTPTASSGKLMTSGNLYTQFALKEPADTTILKEADIDSAITNGNTTKLVSSDQVYDGLVAKEDALGNPDTDGKVLASTTAGVRSWVSQTGGGSIEITEQASDPTAASLSTGDMVVATGSGDLFYKSATGMYTVAGVYAADPTTYTLTFDLVDGNGTDKITYNSTDYTTDPSAFTGLTTDQTFTCTADTGRDCVVTGDNITESGGTYTADTSDYNVSPVVTFSAVSASAACSGSELFCTSWEDGSDYLNTGGDYVFDSYTGTPALSTDAAQDGIYGIAFPNTGGTLTTDNDGSGYDESSISSRLVFRLDGTSESLGVSNSTNVLSLFNSSSYDRVMINIVEDSNNYDEYFLLRVKAKTTSTSLVNIGTDYIITEGVWYQLIVDYTSNDTISVVLYDATGDTQLATWSETVTQTANINKVIIGASANIPLHMDAFSFDDSAVSPL